jgi:hypothetical protein
MQSSQRKWLMTALAAGTVFFVAVGLLSIGSFIVLSKRRSAEPSSLQITWEDPFSSVALTQVSPSTGLMGLAGMGDVTAINTALRSDQVDSAYSLLTTGTRLTDEERIGSLLLVGKRYAAANNVAMARLTYRQVILIATLSPALSDFARADAFSQAGEELAKLKQVHEATIALNQARTVALYSAYLKPAHRKLVLDRLVPAYSALGSGREAWDELEIALKPGGKGQISAADPTDSVLGQLAKRDVALPQVQSAQTDREEKANALAEYVRDRGGKLSDSLVSGLGAALTVEDAMRQGTYEAGILQATTPADKIALLAGRVHWISLKYAVARRAQGVSLVPAWEEQLSTIQSDLAKARQGLYAYYADQIVTLPDESAIDRAWVELYRDELEMGRLGLYPNYPEQQLLSKLREATLKLMAAGRDQGLRVDTVLGSAEHPLLFLADGPDYGKGLQPW